MLALNPGPLPWNHPHRHDHLYYSPRLPPRPGPSKGLESHRGVRQCRSTRIQRPLRYHLGQRLYKRRMRHPRPRRRSPEQQQQQKQRHLGTSHDQHRSERAGRVDRFTRLRAYRVGRRGSGRTHLVEDRELRGVVPEIGSLKDMPKVGPSCGDETWTLTRLNERMRFLRYGKGQYFKRE